MFIFFVQTKKTNQKKIALLVKNLSINFVLKTKIHKLGLCPQTYEFLRFVHCINYEIFFNAGIKEYLYNSIISYIFFISKFSLIIFSSLSNSFSLYSSKVSLSFSGEYPFFSLTALIIFSVTKLFSKIP